MGAYAAVLARAASAAPPAQGYGCVSPGPGSVPEAAVRARWAWERVGGLHVHEFAGLELGLRQDGWVLTRASVGLGYFGQGRVRTIVDAAPTGRLQTGPDCPTGSGERRGEVLARGGPAARRPAFSASLKLLRFGGCVTYELTDGWGAGEARVGRRIAT
jgi:hypothetical protein